MGTAKNASTVARVILISFFFIAPYSSSTNEMHGTSPRVAGITDLYNISSLPQRTENRELVCGGEPLRHGMIEERSSLHTLDVRISPARLWNQQLARRRVIPAILERSPCSRR